MLEWATEYFRSRSVPSPRLSIEWLLAHVLQVKRLDLYLQFDRPLTRDELDTLRPLVQRRAEHEPLQYLTGSTDFYNLTLRVTPDVLIPRPETEQLVEMILDDHPAGTSVAGTAGDSVRFLDIGTGSGCIALAVKKARPDWQVTGIDISEEALEVARGNARENELDVTFLQASLLDYTPPQKPHIIASNPPYINESERGDLPAEVRSFEPAAALFVPDVQKMYRVLADFCRNHLASGGSYYLETHEDHTDNLLLIFEKKPLAGRLVTDYSGKNRFIVGIFEE